MRSSGLCSAPAVHYCARLRLNPNDPHEMRARFRTQLEMGARALVVPDSQCSPATTCVVTCASGNDLMSARDARQHVPRGVELRFRVWVGADPTLLAHLLSQPTDGASSARAQLGPEQYPPASACAQSDRFDFIWNDLVGSELSQWSLFHFGHSQRTRHASCKNKT